MRLGSCNQQLPSRMSHHLQKRMGCSSPLLDLCNPLPLRSTRNRLQPGRCNPLELTSSPVGRSCRLPKWCTLQCHIGRRCSRPQGSCRRSRTTLRRIRNPLHRWQLRRSCTPLHPGSQRFQIRRTHHHRRHRSSIPRHNRSRPLGSCLRSRTRPLGCHRHRKPHIHRGCCRHNRKHRQGHRHRRKFRTHPIPRSFHHRWSRLDRSCRLLHRYIQRTIRIHMSCRHPWQHCRSCTPRRWCNLALQTHHKYRRHPHH